MIIENKMYQNSCEFSSVRKHTILFLKISSSARSIPVDYSLPFLFYISFPSRLPERVQAPKMKDNNLSESAKPIPTIA
jgi:hypothetical protein